MSSVHLRAFRERAHSDPLPCGRSALVQKTMAFVHGQMHLRASQSAELREPLSGRATIFSAWDESDLDRLIQELIDDFDLESLKLIPAKMLSGYAEELEELHKTYKAMEEVLAMGYVRKEEPDWWSNEEVVHSTDPRRRVEMFHQNYRDCVEKLEELQEMLSWASMTILLRGSLEAQGWGAPELDQLEKVQEEEDFQLLLGYQAMEYENYTVLELLPQATRDRVLPEATLRREIYEEMLQYALSGSS